MLYGCSESDVKLKLEVQLRQLQTQLNEKNEQLSQVSTSSRLIDVSLYLRDTLSCLVSLCCVESLSS